MVNPKLLNLHAADTPLACSQLLNVYIKNVLQPLKPKRNSQQEKPIFFGWVNGSCPVHGAVKAGMRRLKNPQGAV